MPDRLMDCRETVLIVNKRGLHAPASAKFVNHLADLPGSVTVTNRCGIGEPSR